MRLLEVDAEDISSRYVKGVRIPRRTLLTLGTSSAGKSETLKHFADDLRADPDSQIVVYDHKTDYQEFFEERGADMIRLSSGVRATRTAVQSRGTSSRRSRRRRTPTSWGARFSPRRAATSGPQQLANCSQRR